MSKSSIIGLLIIMSLLSSIGYAYYSKIIPSTEQIQVLTPDKWFGVENTEDPSQWTTILSRTNLQGWNFTVHRIAFNWDDINLYSNIESCLTLMDSYRIKAVLDAHYVSGHQLIKFGSEQWFINWEQMVTHFKNDSRIIAWEIFNEAFPQYADSSIGGDGTGTNTALHVEALMKAQYDCSVRIRVIDPTRPIIWFPHYLSEEGGTTRWTPLSSPSGINYVSKISNIILTWHMYSYGSKSTLSDLQSQLNYKLPQIIDLSKAYPIWLGETAWHETSAGGAVDPVIEAQYVALILKVGREHGWGFNYWAYRINHYAPVNTYPSTSADAIIRASEYQSLNMKLRVSGTSLVNDNGTVTLISTTVDIMNLIKDTLQLMILQECNLMVGTVLRFIL
jgi:hypothetical protein